ncbi:MAG: hypothetical protein JWP03_2097 [Phycisphaerales bacterium]|jgi:hypothetical protein|nr:hypothetical protein [Phycisphaerales bacterium]
MAASSWAGRPCHGNALQHPFPLVGCHPLVRCQEPVVSSLDGSVPDTLFSPTEELLHPKLIHAVYRNSRFSTQFNHSERIGQGRVHCTTRPSISSLESQNYTFKRSRKWPPLSRRHDLNLTCRNVPDGYKTKKPIVDHDASGRGTDANGHRPSHAGYDAKDSAKEYRTLQQDRDEEYNIIVTKWLQTECANPCQQQSYQKVRHLK